MAFGPIIPPVSSGGGGSFTPTLLTGSTAEIDASDATDVDIALPEGATGAYVLGARITRTSGACALVSLAVFKAAARSDTAAYIYGDNFNGVDVLDGNPIVGPLTPIPGGTAGRNGVHLPGDSGFVRLVAFNRDFANAGAFDIEFDAIVLFGGS